MSCSRATACRAEGQRDDGFNVFLQPTLYRCLQTFRFQPGITASLPEGIKSGGAAGLDTVTPVLHRKEHSPGYHRLIECWCTHWRISIEGCALLGLQWDKNILFFQRILRYRRTPCMIIRYKGPYYLSITSSLPFLMLTFLWLLLCFNALCLLCSSYHCWCL